MKHFLIYTILLTLVLGCGRISEKEQNTIAIEEQVFSDIFGQLIDSFNIRMNGQFLPPPMPLPPGTNDPEFLSKYEEQKKEILKRIDSIDSRLLISLYDTCFDIDFSDLIGRNFSDTVFIKRIEQENRDYHKNTRTWNIEQIVTPVCYQLMPDSYLTEKYKSIWNITDRRFGGYIACSKIYLDDHRQNGLLEFIHIPLHDSGSGYFILIERIDDKWKIKKMQQHFII